MCMKHQKQHESGKTKLIMISCWHHLLQFCTMTSQVNLLRGNLSAFWIVRSFVEREIDFPHKKKEKNYSQSSLSVCIDSCFVVQEICFPQNIMHLRIRMHFSCMETSCFLSRHISEWTHTKCNPSDTIISGEWCRCCCVWRWY